MTEDWLLTLTPETRAMVERMPDDVRTHPLLRVVLSEHFGVSMLNDITATVIVGEVRARIADAAGKRA